VRRACKAFVRTQWEASGPQGWFSEADFATAAAALDNPDWAETVLYEYRHHWGEAAPDPRHVDLAGRQAGARHISVPTLVVHGGGDCAAPAPAYEGMSQRFTSRFERFELPGVGHFPHREAPRETADLITGFLERARSAPRRAA
jgi:pimeloyl-ACP methyl ester carboxylesterase